MNSILIVTREQFGYLTDTYNYCLKLGRKLSITYICLDENRPKIDCEGVRIIYIPKTNINSSFYNMSRFTINHINNNEKKYDVIFCVFFRFCFLIPLLTQKNQFIMDIRTGNVNRKRYKNFIGNLEIRFNSLFFDKISVISETLAQKLKLKEYYVLPLGANRLVKERNKSKEMNLLYIGTFNNRRIGDTIRGYSEYLNRKNNSIPTRYTLIGDGSVKETNRILSVIQECNLKEKVKLVGRKNHCEVVGLFKSHNIGVSYIPMTKYYDVQPPTKTYEYILNGLICIATKTSENENVINVNNGVLCEDNASSFAQGLKKIETNIESYDPEIISDTVKDNTWDNISKNIFFKILLETMRDVKK